MGQDLNLEMRMGKNENVKIHSRSSLVWIPNIETAVVTTASRHTVDAILLFTDVECRINARQAGASYANTDGIGVKTLEKKI